MKLDDTVCRGSLIIHKGDTYVVLASFRYGSKYGDWKITPTPRDGEWHIPAVQYTNTDADVETFFGGAVFEIPDYIR
jgi:hypothetical protein